MAVESLNVHSRLAASSANGPGLRAVVWLQGCPLACPGCFNPETHDTAAGELVTIKDLAAWSLDLRESVEGITISGGEPSQQALFLGLFLREVRSASDLSVILFTGYSVQEVLEREDRRGVLPYIDVLIAGRYQACQRTATGLKGSSNKEFVFCSDRYSLADFEGIPTSEIVIGRDGNVVVTGIDPLRFNPEDGQSCRTLLA